MAPVFHSDFPRLNFPRLNFPALLACPISPTLASTVQVSHSSSISNITCCPRLVSRCHTIRDSFQPQKCIISHGSFLDYLFSCLAELPSILPRALIPLYIVASPFSLFWPIIFLPCSPLRITLLHHTSQLDYFVTCVIMYIASSLLRGVSYNEILMYNSGQLYEYSYYQRLNKRLATGLYRMWIV